MDFKKTFAGLVFAGGALFNTGCEYKEAALAQKHYTEDCQVVRTKHTDAVYEDRQTTCSELEYSYDIMTGEWGWNSEDYPCVKPFLVSPEVNLVALKCSESDFLIEGDRNFYNLAKGKPSIFCEYARGFEVTRGFKGKLKDIKFTGYKLLKPIMSR